MTKYAKKHGLKIVNLPFAGGEYVEADERFGDYRLFDIGLPEYLKKTSM